MRTVQHRDPHFACLDLCDFHCEGSAPATSCGPETAVLLEIWHSGGLLQIDKAIPKGSTVTVGGTAGEWHAEGTVASCRPDPYGFLVEMRVKSRRDWFPHGYKPPYLVRRSAADHLRTNPKILRAS